MLCQLNISDKFRSLNFDERRKKISFIIYHYTETDNLDEAIKLLTCKKRRVSCHFVIDTNGDVYNLVDVNKRAWHAGESIWKRSNDINSRSIGIEIVYPGEKTKSKYSDSQILSIVKLTNILKKKFKISNKNILGHSDIAPNRKIDPGVFFPWKKLSKESIGTWVDHISDNEKLNQKEYQSFLKNLKRIGYSQVELNQRKFMGINKRIIENFHRHHLPELLQDTPNKSSLTKSIALVNLNSN
jgi:N-acetylmuramoyl-L-alanine amidase